MSTGKSIRAYPTLPLVPLRTKSFRWVIREKLVSDIYAHVKRGEYGKASELLLIAVENAPVPVSSVWRPFLATLRQQVPANFVGLQIDNVASGLRNAPPYTASMERVFHDLDRNRLDHAYAAAHSLAMDRGKNLALARGYHGILVACLREIELDQMGAEADRCSSSSSPHVFRLCESVQFLLSKDVYEMPTKHTLREAEKNLALALKLDEGNTYFIAFYAQVLIALDELPMAKKLLDKWYSTEKALTCLRMLMSIDPREVIHQTEYMLDYLKLDPFASQATYFEPFMAMTLSRLNSLDRESLLMVTDIVVNRIELGDAEESCAWECLALLLSYLRKNNQDVIDEVLGRRLAWWRDTYFASDYFLRTKESDLTVYMAVCAQQMLDLEAGHPVYALLSGKLSTDHAEFANAHIRI